MYLNEWNDSRLSKDFNFNCIKSSRGVRGRPSDGLLFGWSKSVGAVVTDSGDNFALIMDTKNNIFVFST
jgi:hypothetical protein